MQSFLAFLLMALLAWVLVSRYTARLDRTWPLAVWASLVLFAHSYQGAVHPIAVYVGVVCALLLRFEFMGGWVVKAIRFIESITIVFVAWQLFTLLRGY